MTQDEWDRYIASAADLLGLEISDEMRAPTRANLQVAERFARLLAQLALDDHDEPAPVFTA